MYLDELTIALIAAIATLVGVAVSTEPSGAEAAYFEQIRRSSASTKTITGILVRDDGPAVLQRRVRQVQWIMAGLVVLAVGIYGLLAFALAI